MIRGSSGWRIRVLVLAAVASGAMQLSAQQPRNTESRRLQSYQNRVHGHQFAQLVAPVDTDPGIKNFLNKNIVLYGHGGKGASLLVFLPGTSGVPFVTLNFLRVAADAGYRVIGLEYDDIPAAAQVCQRERDGTCYGRFREKRIYGIKATDAIPDLPAESVVNRLTKLLEYLERNDPDDGWGDYLQNGAPNWSRIAVSGHSQGAGMAAFIAKRESVARVILFSGPQDYFGWNHELAAWITTGKSATPPERWYAAYHKKEREAATLKRAYDALHIPRDHVRVMTLEPKRLAGMNPYHGSMIGPATPLDAEGKPAYAPDWLFMLGSGNTSSEIP